MELSHKHKNKQTWGLEHWDSLCVVDLASVILLEKIDFPSSSSYQFLVVSRVEVGLCASFPSFVVGFCLA